MKMGKISIIFMTCFMVYIIIMASNVSAVNSFCATGPTCEKGHNDIKKAINEADDELEDYFKDNGQQHMKDTNGRPISSTVMTFQEYQPQNYIYCGHSFGQAIYVDKNGDNAEWLDAQDFVDHIHTAGKNHFYYAAAPFSAIVFVACWTASTDPGTDFCEAFLGNKMRGWIYFGIKNVIMIKDYYNLIDTYTDRITDGKKSYKAALEEAYSRSNGGSKGGYRASYWYIGGYDLHHETRYDKYRYIDRKEENEGGTINNGGAAKTLTYDRNFDGTTNGAYFVFHGVLNNNKYDTTSTANVRIKIYKKVGETLTEISNSLYSNIKNRSYSDEGTTAYGGSDICSRRISASWMSNVGSNSIKVEIKFESGSANNIYIDRCELMEIGK